MARTTRKVLTQKVKELEEQLNAAQGETRQNMRKRLAKLSGENAELKKKVQAYEEKEAAIVQPSP